MSNVSSNQVQGLMEAYTAIYDSNLRYELEEEQLEIEELGLQIIENVAYVLFSQGYDVNDLINYFTEASSDIIAEDAIAISEGTLLIESINVSDEYIQTQFEYLHEGLLDAALKGGSKLIQRAGKAILGVGKKGEAISRAKNIQNIKATKPTPAPKNYDSPVSRALGASPKPSPTPLPTTNPNVIQRGVNWAKSTLGKLPPGVKAAGKFAGKALPVAGAALYGMDAADRFKKGDWGGGLLSGAGAVTSLIPGAGIVAGLAPAGIQMATDAMGLTGDKSLKGKGGAKPTPSPGAPKPKGGAGNVNVPGKGQRYYSSSDKKYYKNYNDALAARNSRRGGTDTPAAPPTSPAPSASPAPSGSGRAPSAPSGGGRAPSAPPKAPPKAAPAASGTPMQQWARANPTLAARVKPGQSGYDEISQIRDKPGPNEKQDQIPTQGPSPSASQQSQLNKTGYAAPESPSSTNAQSIMNNAEQERKKREKQGASTAVESYDAFDLVLEYLTTEGHVDSIDEALYVMMEMDSETIQSICEAYQEPRFKRKHYLKKLSKRGGMGMGTPDDPHGYRDPKMANVGDEFRRRKTAAKKAKQTGEPDTYRAASETRAAENRARGAARRGEG